jgi:hypothetical protein
MITKVRLLGERSKRCRCCDVGMQRQLGQWHRGEQADLEGIIPECTLLANRAQPIASSVGHTYQGEPIDYSDFLWNYIHWLEMSKDGKFLTM